MPAPMAPPPPPPDAGAIADAYGLGRPIGPAVAAARGELGRIWRLETAAGTWAVKEVFEPSTEADAQADVSFQEAALAAGVPMPRPVVGRSGAVFAEIEAPDRRVTVRVHTWVDIEQPLRRAAATDAAGILARLHLLALPDDRPMDAWFSVPIAPDRWRELLDHVTRAAAPWAPKFARLVPEIAAGDSIVAAGRHHPTITCHRDFNPENVLMDAQGRPVVVDWENCGPAAAEQELASVLAEFVPDPGRAPAFLEAYLEAGGPARLAGPSSFAMTLAFQGNLVAWYAERALDPTVPAEDRARSVHWIEDIAANVFTPARIDAWLAAAAGEP